MQLKEEEPLTPPEVKKRNRTTVACNNCHKKKSKCDGQTPCSTCKRLGQPCSYDRPSKGPQGTEDLSYLETLERRIAKLYALLVEHNIAPPLEEQKSPPRNHPLVVESPRMEPTSMSIPDSRITSVRPEVSDSMNAMLMDLFFTRVYPTFHLLDLYDARIFWQNNCLNSAILANAIYCNACRFSPEYINGSTSGLPGDSFYLQAHELTTSELAKPPSMSLVFAFLLMTDYSFAFGRAAVGSTYHAMAVRACVQMGINIEEVTKTPSSFESEMKRRLWWTCVIFDITRCISTRGHSTLATIPWSVRLPRSPNAIIDYVQMNEIEIELELFSRKDECFIPGFVHVKHPAGCMATIHFILGRIFEVTRESTRKLPPAQLTLAKVELELSLLDWLDCLPRDLRLTWLAENPHSVETPIILYMHCLYFTGHLMLYESTMYDLTLTASSPFKKTLYEITFGMNTVINMASKLNPHFEGFPAFFNFCVFKCGSIVFTTMQTIKDRDQLQHYKLCAHSCTYALNMMVKERNHSSVYWDALSSYQSPTA
ncbi:fungal-specific transcription factor domain-containing protein [Gorgonomyces haynaldii]|nr:fungal-specific transcription factor domain-containing protein [Gorgonomyces haynaldii]